MFTAQSMLFIYVESPLHVGAGRGLGTVDLPIQRERVTGYPVVQASSIKGCLRAACDPKLNPGSSLKSNEHLAIFGPETGDASAYAGALSTGDARLLLFPVRSLAGVFAWTTSLDVLARFQRAAQSASLNLDWSLPPKPEDGKAWVSGDALSVSGQVVLEEFSFTADKAQAAVVQKIGEWLAKNALPSSTEYLHWRNELSKKLCILPDNDFRDFAQYATEVQTHICLDPKTKTVKDGALWTAESLPMDSMLYTPLMATDSRSPDADLKAANVLQAVQTLDLPRTQLGGDETTGQGLVALKFA
jgi:CRISPR-associated protein Cmr4